MEDEQQEAPQIRTTAYASPFQHYGSSILTLTNPKSALYQLELTFRGLRENKEGHLERMSEPMMNDDGINSVLGATQSLVNQVTIMGNLSKSEIPALMDFLADTLAKDLMMNRLKYDIVNPTARDKIYFSALSTAFVTMKRAFEEGDRRFWKGSQQEIKTTVQTDTQKKGLFSRLNPWAKN